MPQMIPALIRRKNDRRRWPKPAMTAAFSASLLLLAGCSGAAPNDDDIADEVGLERFMEQELEFGACDASIVDSQPPVPQVVEAARKTECAMLTVPMDYKDVDGTTIEIAVSRISATGDNPIGSVLLNPGGPGAAGTTLAPLVNALWTGGPIPERFDIVGFDPRGVGLSTPAIDCYSDEERDADAPLSALGKWTEESARAIVDKCADGSGSKEILAHLGTRDVARDMDVLRSALGDDKLTYAGVSYGTRLGSVYAEMFPENVRALVLDGAVDPLMDTADRRIQLSEGLQASFQRFADFCTTQAACPLGTDPARATAAAQELLQPLEDRPLVAEDGREVGFLAAGEGIVSGLYSEATDIDGLPEVLVISATGDPVTPHEGGNSLADTLGARLLTVEANQHGTIISANACVDGAVADYLIDLELPDKGTRCTI
ncbi:hypothetical protein GCM10007304_16910 [Rhodococcoides trifolii]|uniref:AB hydrolase-1 domain-containing protein n=1 Tax=Rhodococcoides trifolii TaxID=908250 RepID=A0A917CYF3_9NOCA|nr:alpha/beta hydrolase [Rhodococcus trifolii]GGG03429.1 hypothetical protein GCM10007304_16910 [Rhodococcus trifolii]